MDEFISRLCSLQSAYVELLGRVPDWNGFLAQFGSPCQETHFADIIKMSEEYHLVNSAYLSIKAKLSPYEGFRRILLLGAYGNGNLGDRLMADEVARIIEADGKTICFAHSTLCSASYPFPPDRLLCADDIPLNRRVLSLFDAMVIGGGGLLSYPHEPIWDPSWPYLIPIPYGLFSCGVGVPLDSRLENLVRKAKVVSSRDMPGFQELYARRTDALLCPDPVMSFGDLEAIEIDPSRGRLFVLRAPFCDWHRRLKQRLHAKDAVVVFEAHMDHEISSYFNNVQAVNTSDDFRALARDFRVIVSERFHGAILALLADVPVWGLHRKPHAEKFVSLFEDLGISSHLVDLDDAGYEFAPYEMQPVRLRLKAIREGAVAHYQKFVKQLFASDPDASKPSAAPPRQALDVTGASIEVSNRLTVAREIHDSAMAALLINEGTLDLAARAATVDHFTAQIREPR